MSRWYSRGFLLLAVAVVLYVGLVEPQFFSGILQLAMLFSLAHWLYEQAKRLTSALLRTTGGVAVAVTVPVAERIRRRGDRLLGLTQNVFPTSICSLVFEPVVVDLQDEYLDALGHADEPHGALDPWKARFVLVRGYWAFAAAFVLQLGHSLRDWLVQVPKTS